MSVQGNADAIGRRAGKALDELEARAYELAQAPAPFPRTYIRLRQIADDAHAMVAPNTPCRSGCSHCCYMAVPIAQHEADLIGEHIGRAPAPAGFSPGQDPAGAYHHIEGNLARFERVPCTFLDAAGRCSIYTVRPLPCRIHHVLNDTADDCDLTQRRVPVPAVDLQFVNNALMLLGREQKFADIREFFPKENSPPPER